MDKRILVTGGLGHIGSKLIEFLLKKKFNVIVIDNLATQRYCSLFNLPKSGKFRFIEADINKFDLNTIKNDFEIIVNLAAQTDAASSFKNKSRLFRNNYHLTKLLVKFSESNNKKLIALSSTSVYGTQSKIVDEYCTENELCPQSPYAECKLKEEKLIRKSKTLRFIIFRFGTIFGISKGIRFHTAANKFCWQSAHNEPLSVWKTALNQKRPYLDIDDAINAIYYSIQKDLFDRNIYNILTFNKTVKQIISYIKKYNKKTTIEFHENKIMNQLSYEVSNEKSKKRGFKYRGSLDKQIRATMKLFKNNL